jgi:hypothetical protein
LLNLNLKKMKKLKMESMERIEGGKKTYDRAGCVDAWIGLGVAFASTFTGPAGIVTGLAGFATFVNHAGQCEGAFD